MKRFVSLLLCLALILGLSVVIAENWLCPNCGKETGGNFCPFCGQEKPSEKMMISCSKCGATYDPEAGYAFCLECGTPLNLITGEISDSWEEIIAAIDDGTAQRRYAVGAYKPLDMGNFGVIDMQLAGFNLDDRADGQGKATTTWIAKNQLLNEHRMNPDYEEGKEGTGMIGGWEKSELRQWMYDEVLPVIPDNLRDRLIVVKKVQLGYNTSGNEEWETSEDRLWIPSHDEVFGDEALYYDLFMNENENRVRERKGAAAAWYLRSASVYIGFADCVDSSGSSSGSSTFFAEGVVIGFCL